MLWIVFILILGFILATILLDNRPLDLSLTNYVKNSAKTVGWRLLSGLIYNYWTYTFQISLNHMLSHVLFLTLWISLKWSFFRLFLEKQISTCCWCKFCCVCTAMCGLRWYGQNSLDRLIYMLLMDLKRS